MALSLPLPARWPYSRVLNGVEPGSSVKESVEVLERLVPPEACGYFQRILKASKASGGGSESRRWRRASCKSC